MNLLDIENQIEIQARYKIVYYDTELDKQIELIKCKETKDIKIDFIFIKDGYLIIEINEENLYKENQRNIEHLIKQY